MLNYQNEKWDEPHLNPHNFKAFFDATNQAMFVENRDGYIVSLNAAASKLWGATIAELLGKHASEVLPPKLGISAVGTVRTSRYTRPDGETIPVCVLSTPLTLGDDEAFLTTVWPAEDTAESEATPATADEANVDPQSQSHPMEALERFSGRISHDFNNILTSVVGFGSLMQSDESLTESCRSYVDQIVESAQRAEQLTGELLTFGQCSDAPTTTFLAASAIEKADAPIREILGDKISLTTIIEDNVAPIVGSEEILGEILLQLASNTRDAMEGSAEGAMKIELSSNSDKATLLTVSDNGHGMDEWTAAAAFEPFYSSRNDHNKRGLGLTHVYSATRNLGGTVSLQSNHGEGTKVSFHFPVAKQPKPAIAAVEPKREILPPLPAMPPIDKTEAPLPIEALEPISKTNTPEPVTDKKPTPAKKRSPLPGGSETILVVEDEPMVREIVVRSLTHLGYTVHKACDGQEGLELSRELDGEIDLIFSDIVMPRLSGPEMIEKVREENRLTPVLFTTGFTESKHLLENGGDLREGFDLLQKPYTPNVLAERVREKLDSLLS